MTIEPSQILGKDYNTFSEVDPYNQQNLVSGYIGRVPNQFYGSLLITEVNNKPVTPQLIMCTPKMHYPFDSREDGTRNYSFPSAKVIEIYEKLDGTNILAFSYIDDKHQKCFSYKTRLKPFLGSGTFGDFYSLWNEASKVYQRDIELFIGMTGINLSFELYGSRNPHLVMYKTPLEFALLFGVTPEGKILSPTDLTICNVPFVNLMKTIDRDYVYNYETLQKELEETLSARDDGLYTGIEGTVWYLKTADGKCLQVKCLDGRSNILTENGWQKLSIICNSNYQGKVATLINKKIEWRRVIGHYRTPLSDRQMLRIGLKHARKVNNGKAPSFKGTNATVEHQFLTKDGWKCLGSIRENDEIYTGFYQPNQKQYEFIIGSLLGDGTCSSLNFETDGTVYDYHELKNRMLSILRSSGGTYKYDERKRVYYSICRTSAWSKKLYEKWYTNKIKNIKTVPRDLILTDFILAVWYMDDGSLFLFPSGNFAALFATSGFSQEDTEFLSKILYEQLDIKSHVRKDNNLYIHQESSVNFFNRISPYVPEGMRYKIPPNFASFCSKLWEPGLVDLETDQAIIAESTCPDNWVYCIDVEEGHNFVTSSGIVHNCKPETIEAIHFAAAVKAISKNVITTTVWNSLENTDAPTVDFIKQLLKEEFRDELVEGSHRFIQPIIDKVLHEAAFRRKVMDTYRGIGKNILVERKEVMRELAKHFSQKELEVAYCILNPEYAELLMEKRHRQQRR